MRHLVMPLNSSSAEQLWEPSDVLKGRRKRFYLLPGLFQVLVQSALATEAA
jgi:hypothetical protein